MTHVTMQHGVEIDLLNPNLFHVTPGMIFSTLASLPRYNAQTCRFYSVLEHSVLGAKHFESIGNPRNARRFLWHDAHEALIGDITKPVAIAAEITDQLTALKMRIDAAIKLRFGVTLGTQPIIDMDHAMFFREWRDLMTGSYKPEPPAYTVEPIDKYTGLHREWLLAEAYRIDRWAK